MKKTVLYTAHGLILVMLLDGRKGIIELKNISGKTKEEILEQANSACSSLNGGLNGIRFIMIIGAVLSITKTISVILKNDETEYTNETYQFDSVGELSPQEFDLLERKLLEL